VNDSAISARLKKEISPLEASVTGYFISCAIETELGMYFDHNVENPDTLEFEHAEHRTLTKALESEESPKIKRVLMYGEGKVLKSKHYVPCLYCARELLKYIQLDTTIKLLQVSDKGKEREFNFQEVLHSYRTYERSNLYAHDRNERCEFLNTDTLLRGNDRDFILDLVDLCVEDEVSLYITGSASGRGGFSNYLLQKTEESYKDIDLFFVLQDSRAWEFFLDKIRNLVQKHYNGLELFFRNVPPYQNRRGVVLGKAYFYDEDETEPIIDMTFSTNLEGSFIRSEYYEQNWFHKLTP
jgi:cytidine deaminase